ncbi:MAG TPA: HAD-IIIC family phosphatase [Burkholderiales bacterium]|nr:HAD-IIIC family phosphatase [Burkholderiales bacterium]
MASALAAYGAWNGLEFNVLAGPYDDTMSLHLEGKADLELVWLDVSRLTGLDSESIVAWLIERLQVLRAATINPIICLAFPLPSAAMEELQRHEIPGVQFPDMNPLATETGPAWLDSRTLVLSGTRLSSVACMRIARELACRWIPASTMPPVKAMVVDLDNTLFSGVIAEDESHGVRLTPAHRALQSSLVSLHEQGVYLALVSRNEMADIETLFAARPDFPLRLSHFATVQASWDDKSIALRKVADALRIDFSAMAYVDDNAGELAEIAEQLPLFTVHAGADALQTCAALNSVAGLFRWRRSREDGLRAIDIGTSARRASVAATARSRADYLRDLQVRLGYAVNDKQTLPRVHELVHKTNQFNVTLRRLSEVELARMTADENSRVVTISLEDRLSDSGLIGVVAATRDADTLIIAELCLSCRALGRHLESTMVTHALRILAGELPVSRVTFPVRIGPRNGPARKWLATYLGLNIGEACSDLTAEARWLVERPVDELVTVRF